MIKLDKLAYVARVPIVFGDVERKPEPVRPRRRKREPLVLRDVSEDERNKLRDQFLSIFKGTARLARKRGHYLSHSQALDGIARRIGVLHYSGLKTVLDAEHPDRYPWVKVKDLRDDLLESNCIG